MPTLVSIEDEFENQRHSNMAASGARAIAENQRRDSTTTRVAARLSFQDNSDNDGSSEGSSDDSTSMGISSKNANGSIRKCAKVGATRTKWKLNALRGSHYFVSRHTAFIPEVYCKLCKRRSISKELAKSYKKGHHKKCPNKPSNRGRLQNKNVYTNPWQRQSQQQSSAGTISNFAGLESRTSTNQDQENGMQPTGM